MISFTAGAVHLDASFLIRALVAESAEALKLHRWNAAGRTLTMSALAWSQFLCGPVETEDQALAERMVRAVVPIGSEEASRAARLFNDTGRRRSSFQDCVIAAAAILARAPLATTDHADFERFRPLGLEIAD